MTAKKAAPVPSPEEIDKHIAKLNAEAAAVVNADGTPTDATVENLTGRKPAAKKPAKPKAAPQAVATGKRDPDLCHFGGPRMSYGATTTDHCPNKAEPNRQLCRAHEEKWRVVAKERAAARRGVATPPPPSPKPKRPPKATPSADLESVLAASVAAVAAAA